MVEAGTSCVQALRFGTSTATMPGFGDVLRSLAPGKNADLRKAAQDPLDDLEY